MAAVCLNPFRAYPGACLQLKLQEGRAKEALCRRSFASIQRSGFSPLSLVNQAYELPHKPSPLGEGD